MGPTREEVLKAERCNGFASWDDDDVLDSIFVVPDGPYDTRDDTFQVLSCLYYMYFTLSYGGGMMVSTKKNVPGEGNRGPGDESPAQEGGKHYVKESGDVPCGCIR